MKRKYEDIDRLIERALTKEEAEYYHKFDEQSLPEMVGGLFSGRLRWVTIMTMIVMVVIFALAIYCLIQFLSVDDTGLMIKWAAATFGCMMAVGMLKMFQWMQMDKNALLRELKRLEYQVAILAGKVA